MIFSNEIDLGRLSTIPIDGEIKNFQVRWDNTILITAYDAQRTFILTDDGHRLLLRSPLRVVLKRFCEDNDISPFKIAATYRRINHSKGRGYICGRWLLVPTHGTTNANVAFYMAHFLKYHCWCKERDRVMCKFECLHYSCDVYVDTSLASFDKIINAADRVSYRQKVALIAQCNNYNLTDIPVLTDYYDRAKYRRVNHEVEYDEVSEALRPYLLECLRLERQSITKFLRRLFKVKS